MKQDIVYFEKTGRAYTAETLAAAKARALVLGIRQVLVASSHGYTARETAKAFAGTGIEIIAVSLSEGFKEKGWCMTPEQRQALQGIGVKVLTVQHSLSGGAGESLLGESSPLSIIANTLYCFSQGMKVAVEITMMAADAGWTGTENEVLAIAGTGGGADTAIVLVPACARQFKDLRIREIICKPREG
jgi:hypothetical protein